MKTVVLLHQQQILHYRVAIYNRLSVILREQQWRLVVLAQGVEAKSPHAVDFELRIISRRIPDVLCRLRDESPDSVILFVNAREPYLFPVLLWLKANRTPAIYWGHGIDLEDKGSRIKRLVYGFEHSLCDAILLYSEQLKQYILPKHRHKIFVARNTIDTSLLRSSGKSRAEVLGCYGITSSKNIICVGRMQRRKRIFDLVEAFKLLGRPEYGLILVGPDNDDCLVDVGHPGIYKLGPKFGVELADLLCASEVYCMPGHVGLGIVDAMYFGLPFVTEAVDHAPEIMYLRDGVTGFIVPSGDVSALAERIGLLLEDDQLRRKFAQAARETIEREASVERMGAGFLQALEYATGCNRLTAR